MRPFATIVLATTLTALAGLGAARAIAHDSEHARIARGRYLAQAGDCAACHTADGGADYAGNRPVPTPFGTIYASNLTPDKETGIGNWSDDDFWRAMHDGKRPDGQHLYPAFPYPWYTHLSRDDVLAIKAFLDTLKPAHQVVRPPDLPWPMSMRSSVAGWNLLFFHPGELAPDPSQSAEWNRGAYLVEGLGHCSACHSPKNALGGVKRDARFEGGMGEGWFATSLRGTAGEGLGDWSVDDIVTYLKTGANARARALGPMAEVVEHSTRYLSEPDLHAMAVYLKALPGSDRTERSATAAHDDASLARGKLVYLDQCAGCHMENGEGMPGVFPPIKGNTALHARDVTSLARLVLDGARSARTPQKPEGFAMPGFADKLTDQEIADVLTYARTSFGNQADAVSASAVANERKTLHASR